MEAFSRTLYSNCKDGYDLEFRVFYCSHFLLIGKSSMVAESSVPDPDVIGLLDPHPDP
jgi:hypothetical protein